MIRTEPRTTAVTVRPSDQGEAGKFRAAVQSGHAPQAYAMRAEVSTLYDRLHRSGQGHRMRDLMPELHQAMRDDMAELVDRTRAARGQVSFFDLTRAGYSAAMVTLFAEAWQLPVSRERERAAG